MSVYASDVRQLDAIFAEEAAVHDQHPLVQHVGQGQPAEGVSEELNHLRGVLVVDLQQPYSDEPSHC